MKKSWKFYKICITMTGRQTRSWETYPKSLKTDWQHVTTRYKTGAHKNLFPILSDKKKSVTHNFSNINHAFIWVHTTHSMSPTLNFLSPQNQIIFQYLIFKFKLCVYILIENTSHAHSGFVFYLWMEQGSQMHTRVIKKLFMRWLFVRVCVCVYAWTK